MVGLRLLLISTKRWIEMIYLRILFYTLIAALFIPMMFLLPVLSIYFHSQVEVIPQEMKVLLSLFIVVFSFLAPAYCLCKLFRSALLARIDRFLFRYLSAGNVLH